MPGKRKKKKVRSLFEGIRKPTAPPSRKIDEAAPEEKKHPALRKIKHKKKLEEKNGDL